MAAHPPGTLPPDDGSAVFRKSSSKSAARKAPPPDDLAAEEPTDLVELSDDESMPIGDLPTAAALRTDADLVIDEVLFDDDEDGPRTEPLRPELSEQPTDPEPLFPAVGRGPAGDEESVVLSGQGVAPSYPGSGWYDPPAPPSTGKFEDAAQLFADLRGDAPESTTEWEHTHQAQATGRVSESDLFRAFDEAEADTEVGRPHLSPQAPPPDNSDVFSVIPAGSGSLPGASGVNLTDPHPAAPPPSKPADPDLDPVSSIFAKGAGGPASHDPTDELPLLDDVPLADPATGGGSSIFDRALARPPLEPDADDDAADTGDDAEAVGFELPDLRGDSGSMSQVSGRIDLSTPFDDPLGSGAPLASLAEEDTAPDSTSGGEPTKPARTGKVTVLDADLDDEPKTPKAKSGTAKASPARRDEPPEDEEPAAGRSSGVGKFVGGTAFGLLAGGVAFAALYLTGVIPNERKDAAVALVNRPSADPEAAAKLTDLQKQYDTLKQQGDAADAEVKRLTGLVKTGADGLKAELAQAKTDADKARADTAAVKNDLAASIVKAADAKKEADSLREVVDGAKKQAADATKAMTAAKAELDDEKKRAANAELAAKAVLTDTDAKRKAAEDKLAGLVKEFKDAKILGDGDDLSKLPAAVKRMAATATSTDSKKAADALLAAQKELDTTKAAAKKAADDLAVAVKAKADTETRLTAQKTEADKQIATLKTASDKRLADAKAEADKLVADAKKGVDDKVKAAVAAATQESKKQLAAATTAAKQATDALAAAKTTARTEAEADARKAIEAATARANAAEAARLEAQKGYEQKLADQAEQFAARIADAKSGAVVPILPAETAALEKAAKSYADGMALFLAGRYAEAEPLFQSAATHGEADARHWYFLGLTEYQLGRPKDAAAAFKKGADLEARGKPNSKKVGESLERVQSYLRRVLAEYRP